MHTQRTAILLSVSIVVAAVVLSGCGGSSPVSGTVDVQSSPNSEAVGTAAPDSGAMSAAAVGGTESLQPVLIGLKSAPGPSDEGLVKSKAGKIKYTFQLVPVIAASLPARAIDALKRNPRVAYIEPDATVQASADTVPWGICRVKADLCWPAGNVGLGARVAVLDTGADYRHPDLAPNYRGGYDFVNKDNDPMDDHGHGTHVSGTVTAAADGAGVEGVAPRVSLYELKVLDNTGSGSWSNVIAGLQWCVNNGIQVASMSLGSRSGSTSLQAACDAAYSAGVLLVAAAGNSGSSRATSKSSVEYPAGYASVIAVAATDGGNTRASFSSTGPKVELAAPGVSIVSDMIGGGVISSSGTSMACPHVAGAAALVIASGVTGASAIRQRLTGTASDLGTAGRDTSYGYGLVNAAKASGLPG